MKNVNAALWEKEHNVRVAKFHEKTNHLHSQHNKRVADFHRNHTSAIETGKNGNGLIARWERLVYNKWKALKKAVK
jgi:galactokinase